ncbi:hypothetical protein [Williamsia soli]|uniref:hypothetical protein n=1 Tax=Williamsia soli TaxID=364929 RepID=UPI001A9CF153|nr:hypothetical protein [Williamsia soli]
MSARFRKKPVEIEAWQFTAASAVGYIAEWIERNGGRATYGETDSGSVELQIHTLEGVMTASVGDWVIRGVQGEFYPCKPTIFAEAYDPA